MTWKYQLPLALPQWTQMFSQEWREVLPLQGKAFERLHKGGHQVCVSWSCSEGGPGHIWKFTLVTWKRRNNMYVECQHEGFHPAIYGTQGRKSFERIDNICMWNVATQCLYSDVFVSDNIFFHLLDSLESKPHLDSVLLKATYSETSGAVIVADDNLVMVG